jgi:hypothetical protein
LLVGTQILKCYTLNEACKEIFFNGSRASIGVSPLL